MSVWFLVTRSCGPGWHTASFFPLYKLHLAFVWSTGRKCLTFWAILPQIRPFWENFYFRCIAHSFFYGWKEISIPSHYTVSGITCSNWSNPWGAPRDCGGRSHIDPELTTLLRGEFVPKRWQSLIQITFSVLYEHGWLFKKSILSNFFCNFVFHHTRLYVSIWSKPE